MDNQKKTPPAPEELHAQGDKSGAKSANPAATPLRRRIRTYRPSHKATFIGIGVIVAILAINAAVILIVIKAQSKTATSSTPQNAVTISSDTLSKLGVNRDSVGASQTQLTVDPDSTFKGSVTIGGDANVAGQLKLNGTFNASSASLAKLQAGDTALDSLNVNGDGTISTLTLRKDLAVAGNTRLQGPVTVSQLLTVNNSLNVSGNLAIGGTLSTRSFSALTITAGNGLTIGGHINVTGSAPNVGPGGAVGSNGTVSISGSDAAGTVGVNAGTGAGNGIVAQVAFRSAYSSTPHVVVTPVGIGVPFYINRTAYGFSIGVSGSIPPGGYAFDYIVVQ